jgi:hypothetical protein
MTARRTFIAQAAAIAAAPFISTGVTRALAAASRKKLGFALRGLGSLSSQRIAPALQKTSHCRLTAIITDTPAKATDWKSRYNIADRNIYSYDTMHRIADDPDIDVVYIVTPNALHLDNALAAAKAGKHVFCEKPLEISVERCQKMIDALKAANRRLGSIRHSTTTASVACAATVKRSNSRPRTSLPLRWTISRNASWRRNPARFRARKACAT